MSTIPDDGNQISVEDVITYLHSGAAAVGSATQDEGPELENIEIAPEVVESTRQRSAADEGEDHAPDPDFPQTLEQVRDQMGVGGLEPPPDMGQILAKLLEVDPSTVQLIDAEREDFVAAVCENRPLRLQIPLAIFRKTQPPVLRCLTVRERDLALRAVGLHDRNKFTEGDWYTKLAKAHLAMQLVQWPGIDEPGVVVDSKMTDETALHHIRVFMTQHLEDVNDARWRLLQVALRVFEIKMALLQSEAQLPGF